MVALNTIKGDMVANNLFRDSHQIDLIGSGMDDEQQMIDVVHYSTAINACYCHRKHFMALKILHAMQLHTLTLSDGAVQGIILAYYKLVEDAAHKKFLNNRKQKKKKKDKVDDDVLNSTNNYKISKVTHIASFTKANAAISMIKALKDPQMRLRATVASACADSGM